MSSISNLSASLGGFPGEDEPASSEPLTPSSSYKPTSNRQSDTESDRIDPRTGDLLWKAKLPHPSGRQIEIDYNPKTGGVFLDSGELKDLSEIKDIIPRLETILSTNN